MAAEREADSGTAAQLDGWPVEKAVGAAAFEAVARLGVARKVEGKAAGKAAVERAAMEN